MSSYHFDTKSNCIAFRSRFHVFPNNLTHNMHLFEFLQTHKMLSLFLIFHYNLSVKRQILIRVFSKFIPFFKNLRLYNIKNILIIKKILEKNFQYFFIIWDILQQIYWVNLQIQAYLQFLLLPVKLLDYKHISSFQKVFEI